MVQGGAQAGPGPHPRFLPTFSIMADNETFRFLGGLRLTILFSVCVRIGACLGVLSGTMTGRLEAILNQTSRDPKKGNSFWSKQAGSEGQFLEFFGTLF